MRESILKAVIDLFAIISAGSTGTVSRKRVNILKTYLNGSFRAAVVDDYIKLFTQRTTIYREFFNGISPKNLSDQDSDVNKVIAAKCIEVKEDLTLNERMIVLQELFEFLLADKSLNLLERRILEIITRSFDIPEEDSRNAISMIYSDDLNEISPANILILGDNTDSMPISKERNYKHWKKSEIKGLDGHLVFLYVNVSSTMLFIYNGSSSVYFDGNDIVPNKAYFLERGMSIKGKSINPIYFSTVLRVFIENKFGDKILFEGKNIGYSYKNTGNGIKPFSFSAEGGNLIGVIGGSGVGKSTLFKILAGRLLPEPGTVLLNGFNINDEFNSKREQKGVIGNVPQEDLLIEELTVYQNLYFNAKLCFGNLSEDELRRKVYNTLTDLEIMDIRDQQIGDISSRKVSGGQRKRINIGLELMREPSILLVDEPTSGLSSSDSEKVMNLLQNQALRGRLVIVIIHQPSSQFLKLFDRLWVFDMGGYIIYDGDAVDSLHYFKTQALQIEPGESECQSCGHVDAGSILEIVGQCEIDKNGQHSRVRRIAPEEWSRKFKEHFRNSSQRRLKPGSWPSVNYTLPGRVRMLGTFLERNVLRKISDKQYLALNLLEAPLLALILAFFSKYSRNGNYNFAENINYPIFLFMAIIVSLFIGLTISAEEIFRDRRILERERHINISRLSYLLSKIGTLFFISAIQTLSFLLVANAILEVKGMLFQNWAILFTTACFGNLLGLVISASMKSVISIYILVPLILVPQMLLAGVMIRFDDLHYSLSGRENVPFIGDVMATRWAYEAMAVEQFRSNDFQEPFFEVDRAISQLEWKANFLIPALQDKVQEMFVSNLKEKNKKEYDKNYSKLSYHFNELTDITGLENGFTGTGKDIDSIFVDASSQFLDSARKELRNKIYTVTMARDHLHDSLITVLGSEGFTERRLNYHNESLANLVLSRNRTDKLYESEKMFIQKADPVYLSPLSKTGAAHYYAPEKIIGDYVIPAFWFNLGILWIMIIILFIVLYYNLLKKLLVALEKIGIPNIRLSPYQFDLKI